MSGYRPNQLLIYLNESLDPAWNLALEEYLLRHREEDFLILWRNRPAIVTGKHQLSYREVNYPFCHDHGIDVYRRLSGGGTVFHDEGNLNFTMIENRPDKNRMIDFKRYLQPVAAFLNEWGIPAELSDRNDLLVNEFKISGNAQHIEQKMQRVIHHGTLLLNADLASLREGLKSTGIRYKTKAVESVRTKVMNINDLKGVDLRMDEITSSMSQYFRNKYDGELFEPSAAEKAAVDKLAEEKYRTWQWNIGYSPTYEAFITLNGDKIVRIKVKNGIILEAEWQENGKYSEIIQLKDKTHSVETMIWGCAEVEEFKSCDWRDFF